MLAFLTIGCGDEDGYQTTDSSLRDRAHAHAAKRLAHNDH
jgi:hypothetical protein